MENCGSIPKLSGLPAELPMAINCEYGAFDNEHLVLPRTEYDITIDQESPRPNEQAFEKMTAGLYLGEIFRQVLVDYYDRGLIFKGQNPRSLKTSFILDDRFIFGLEEDFTSRLARTRKVLKTLLHLEASDPELLLCRRIGEIVAIRRARLTTCGISAICNKKNIIKGHGAFDAHVVAEPQFKARWSQALGEVLGWPEDRKQDPYVSSSFSAITLVFEN
jgi:hexokinase